MCHLIRSIRFRLFAALALPACAVAALFLLSGRRGAVVRELLPVKEIAPNARVTCVDCWDGAQTTSYWIESEALNRFAETINRTPCTPVSTFTPELPVYVIRWIVDERPLTVTVTGRYLLLDMQCYELQTPAAPALDALCALTEPDPGYDRLVLSAPAEAALALHIPGQYDKRYLNVFDKTHPMRERKFTDPQYAFEMTLLQQEGELLTVRIRNPWKDRELVMTSYFPLCVQLDGVWYEAPCVTPYIVTLAALYVSPGFEEEKTFDLRFYWGDLPPGRYRLYYGSASVDFTID